MIYVPQLVSQSMDVGFLIPEGVHVFIFKNHINKEDSMIIWNEAQKNPVKVKIMCANFTEFYSELENIAVHNTDLNNEFRYSLLSRKLNWFYIDDCISPVPSNHSHPCCAKFLYIKSTNISSLD